ncbi:hypothetical protein [Halarcobacter sp.]|uniref:hypothetical protein n=1 Tax=Halarcobacter sp. TaxID=2321133 RepID=UPI002AA5F2AE|nr:hypothetical protein [Halarcobacter sp.]
MLISNFLNDLKDNSDEIVYLCAFHMLNKQFDIESDELKSLEIINFFIDYNNYDKYLNDYANVIYNKYESSNNEVFESLCNYFNENPDNKYLYKYRLKRVINQDPKKYLTIEDSEMRNNAIFRVEDKIKVIEESEYYKSNLETLDKSKIDDLKKDIVLVKRAVGL